MKGYLIGQKAIDRWNRGTPTPVEGTRAPKTIVDDLGMVQAGMKFVKLSSEISPGIWTAVEAIEDGTIQIMGFIWDADTPLYITGPAPKTGLCMMAVFQGDKWRADSYTSRQLDWGDSFDTVPFVFEGGIMKVKTWTTDDGITWTREKIDLSDEEC